MRRPCAYWPELLVDHANCEKKAASTALALMFAYPEDRALSVALARLAREELRHFEQVLRVMTAAGVPFARQRPGRYAHELRRALRSAEPGRKLDLLLTGALIEARSAERFALLAPRLPPPLAPLYAELGAARHATSSCMSALPARQRPRSGASGCCKLAAREAQLVTSPERVLRFHSGPPECRA